MQAKEITEGNMCSVSIIPFSDLLYVLNRISDSDWVYSPKRGRQIERVG